ncbi:MAG: HAD family hydrolase [Acidobacteria bacterium]|nr:MAG: HAD family hydrolase [Acidobacteriota bacterium]
MADDRGPFAGRDVALLDAGGTLLTLDTDRVRAALGEAGGRPTDAELLSAEAEARRWAGEAVRRTSDWRAIWDGYFTRMLEGAGVPAERIPAAIDRLWRANGVTGLWRRAMPGARQALERLRAAGYRLAVVSNAEGRVAEDLAAAGLADLLETVVDSHLVGVAKPDARIFEIALERLGVAPSRAFYVGDVPAFDVEGAKAAGLPVVLVDAAGLYPDVGVPRIKGIGELPDLLGL